MFCLTTRSENGVNFHPTYANIERTIQFVLSRVQSGDQILIMLSGHGLLIDKKSYFCPEDADDDLPESTLIDIEGLYEKLNKSEATNKLLIVDACRSRPKNSKQEIPANIVHSTSRDPLGGRRSTVSAKAIEKLPSPPPGIILLTSCNEGEYSFEDDKLKHGVFSYYLIDAFQGKADANQDGFITLTELFDYVCNKTPLYTVKNFSAAQTPYLMGKTTTYYIAQSGVSVGDSGGSVGGNSEGAKEYILDLSKTKGIEIPAEWHDENGKFVVGNIQDRKVLKSTSREWQFIEMNDVLSIDGDFYMEWTVVLPDRNAYCAFMITAIGKNGEEVIFRADQEGWSNIGKNWMIFYDDGPRSLEVARGLAASFRVERAERGFKFFCKSKPDAFVPIPEKEVMEIRSLRISLMNDEAGIYGLKIVEKK